jgi:hypothetical protein
MGMGMGMGMDHCKLLRDYCKLKELLYRTVNLIIKKETQPHRNIEFDNGIVQNGNGINAKNNNECKLLKIVKMIKMGYPTLHE